MKNVKILSILILFGIATFADAIEDGNILFETKCSMCHSKQKPENMDNVAAPALVGIVKHVKMIYPKKVDAVKFMVDYVLAPSLEKAICMPKKIERFGLMPSQKENISKEELESIAIWMYDNFPSVEFVQTKNQAIAGKNNCSKNKKDIK